LKVDRVWSTCGVAPRSKVARFDDHLMDRGYLIIPNKTLEAVAAAARNNYLEVFEREKLHSPAEEFTYELLSKLGHWKKSAIGSRNGLASYRS
jgi:hypothetical protein